MPLRVLPSWLEAALALALLACFLFLAGSHAARTSATFDEPAHLVAGYTNNRWNDFRVNREHPPLVKRLAALPLTALQPWPEAFDPNDRNTIAGDGSMTLGSVHQSWSRAIESVDAQWPLGHGLLFGVKDATLQQRGVTSAFMIDPLVPLQSDDFLNNADRLVFRARLVVIVLGLVLALLAWLWSRQLFGPVGGLLTLALCCFDPNLIAHSSLITTDVGASLFILAGVFVLWQLDRGVSWRPLIGGTFIFGLAAASKFSAVILAPMALLLATYSAVTRGDWQVSLLGARQVRSVAGRLGVWACVIFFLGAGAYVGLWAAYGFRYSAVAQSTSAESLDVEGAVLDGAAIRLVLERFPDNPTPAAVDEVRPTVQPGAGDQLILFANRHRILPEAYLYGLAHARGKALVRYSFLRGEISVLGFATYFPWAFMLKTPLVTLATIGLLIALLLVRPDLRRRHLVFLLLPPVLYFGLSLMSNLNIGHRHLLPIYPLLFVACGTLGKALEGWMPQRRTIATVGVVVLIAVGSSVVLSPPWRPTLVWPHYLSFFNELVGGPENGHRYLLDSNVDWGQGLPELKRWLDEQGISEPINLCYFGQADPRFYGIPHVKLPDGYIFTPPLGPTTFDHARRPGYVAISATNLAGIYQSEQMRQEWRRFLAGAEPVTLVGNSIFVFSIGPASAAGS